MPFGAVKVSKEPVLIKTYKDGSKRYRVDACPRCGGTGFVPYNMDSGRCWKCGGSGYAPYEYTEDSDERKEKKTEKNKVKLIMQADQHNENFFKSYGFNKDGISYIIPGNTFDIKDDIKAAGGKFDYLMGWKLPQKPTQWDSIEISINDIAEKDENGWYRFKPQNEITDFINSKKKEFEETHRNPDDNVSEYVGNVGDKITVDVTIKRISSFDTHFSYHGETQWVYKFEDKDGNIYIWKTSTGLDKEVNGHLRPMEENDTCKISGTIKDHKEYRGEKETILTRVKKI